MIAASHPFIRRQLNFRDENGDYGCAECGRPASVHPQPYGGRVAALSITIPVKAELTEEGRRFFGLPPEGTRP